MSSGTRDPAAAAAGEARHFRDRALVGRNGDAEDQRFGAEIQAAVGLIAIQEATELEDAVLIGSLFDA
jgi:hypothetical protein